MAKFTPLHDRILVRRIEEGETTRGGIIIPDSAKEKPQEGEVISTGKGRITDDGKTFPLAVKEGDRVLFGKYSGTEIKIDGEDFIIMKEEEVLGILTAPPARQERNWPAPGSSRLRASAVGLQPVKSPDLRARCHQLRDFRGFAFSSGDSEGLSKPDSRSPKPSPRATGSDTIPQASPANRT